MMKHIPSINPARAAIAAVLALGSTPLMAQTADQVAPPPVTATQPAMTAPAAPAPVAPPVAVEAPIGATPPAPVMAPPSPVVQQIPQPVAAPSAEEAAPVEQAAPAPRAAKTATRPVAKVAAAPAKSVEAAPAVAAVAAPVTPAPAAPVVDPAPVTDTAPSALPVAAAPMTDDSTLQWGLAAGGLLLLGGIGAAMAMRRRRPVETIAEDDSLYATAEAPIVREPVPAAPVAVAPAAMAAPVLARESEAVVTAPAGSLEDMVARAPSKDNPFLTRKNRLRRATFLMQQHGTVAAEASAATVTAQTSVQKPREAPVYDFGKMGKPRKLGGLFPART